MATTLTTLTLSLTCDNNHLGTHQAFMSRTCYGNHPIPLTHTCDNNHLGNHLAFMSRTCYGNNALVSCNPHVKLVGTPLARTIALTAAAAAAGAATPCHGCNQER